MRLGIVCDFFVPDNKAVAHRMHYLSKALKDSGFEVTLFTSKKSKGYKDLPVVTNFTSPGSNKDTVFLRLVKELAYASESFFRLLLSNKDLYVVTSPPFTLAFASMLALRLRGKRIVLDIRDEYPEVFFSEGLIREQGIIASLLRKIERWMYSNAWLITTVTKNIREKLLRKSGKNVDEVVLLRNGYAEKIAPGDITHPKDGCFKVIFHGNFGKFQEPDLIGRLAQLCLRDGLNVQFEVYGWGVNTKRLSSLELPNLKFHGEVPHEAMARVLGSHHLGVSFQKESEIAKNSFPSKVYEFMGAGIPSLITPLSEAGDFVQDNRIGYQFSSEAPDEIYHSLRGIVQSQELWAQMRRNAINLRDEYSRVFISSAFSELLKSRLPGRNNNS